MHPHDLRAAVEALASAGCQLVDAPQDVARRPLVGQLHLLAPAGTPIDLHWHLLYRHEDRARSTIDTAAVLERRELRQIGGRSVPTMTAAEHLAYVCVHAARAGAHRLRWLCDAAYLADDPDLDWGDVVAIARRWRLARPVAVVLGRARVLVGALVPESVLRDLDSSRSWCAVDRFALLVDPLASSPDHASLTASVARHSQDHLGDAWQDLLRAVTSRRGRDMQRAAPERLRLLRTPGGLSLLAGYYADVAATAEPSPTASQPVGQ